MKNFLKSHPQIYSTDISLEKLFSNGKTIEWSDLPTRLWATTGIKLKNLSSFKKFGTLRNGIQHFGAVPYDNLDGETLKFIFEVLDPFINDCWGLYAVNNDEDSDSFEIFPSILLKNEIEFLVPKNIVEYEKYWDVDWNELSENYRHKMQKRIEEAKP